MPKPILASIAALAFAISFDVPAADAGYPDRPVTIVVPASPGGGGDFAARLRRCAEPA